MVAHVAGVPIEESLPWLMPVAGFGISGLIAALRRGLARGRRGEPR